MQRVLAKVSKEWFTAIGQHKIEYFNQIILIYIYIYIIGCFYMFFHWPARLPMKNLIILGADGKKHVAYMNTDIYIYIIY